MKALELTPRLHMVAELIPRGARVADVGTDHAYLPVWLLQNGVTDRVIASDLRSGPLRKAEETVQRHGLEGRIALRLCDGLRGMEPHEADTVVIAGMGGETIAAILGAAPWTRDSLCVLQPMSKQSELRAFLVSHGYRITEERICREGKTLYITIVATGGATEPYSAAELHVGRQTAGMDAPLRGAYLDWHIRRAARALAGVRQSAESTARADALAALLEELHERKKEWCAWQR